MLWYPTIKSIIMIERISLSSLSPSHSVRTIAFAILATLGVGTCAGQMLCEGRARVSEGMKELQRERSTEPAEDVSRVNNTSQLRIVPRPDGIYCVRDEMTGILYCTA